ncbi:hypothetical protein K438DRAFT_1756108 [Mycena galopus ATCC 62051]|nr:hypothetical protein K438DRAFT_1756108 [Mycena galopus ATCC 62051]
MTSLSTSKLLALLALFGWQAHAGPASSPHSIPARDQFTCPHKQKCLEPWDCLYANPDNCNSFIACVPQADGTGKPVAYPCPLDLQWDDNRFSPIAYLQERVMHMTRREGGMRLVVIRTASAVRGADEN